MPETKGLALAVFVLLNALGVGFLVYVLVNFWKEGHQASGTVRSGDMMSARGPRPDVVVVTAAIEGGKRRSGGRVIQFPVQAGSGQEIGGESGMTERASETSRSAAQ